MTRVSIALAVIIACGPTYVGAQSLADVARAEEARRKTVEKTTKTARVYTNQDLKADPGGTAAPSASTTPEATLGAPGAVILKTPTGDASDSPAPATRDEAYWSGRLGEARKAVERSRLFADALQSRINALNTDFVNRDDPAQRAVIEGDRKKALDELQQVQKEIDNQTKAIVAIQDEGRRAGVPAGWLR
ncbi:MAG: hypothetical protein ABI665_07335 [Vicinamibacterales bacterium]